jgi:HlyD family secretion protein
MEQDDRAFDERLEELMKPGQPEKKQKKWRPGLRCIKGVKAMSRKKKWMLAGAGVFAVFLLASALGGGEEAIPRAAVVPLEKRDIQEVLTLSGPISGTDSVDVVSNIHAEILSIDVKEGDKVKKGQLLAVLDSQDLEREVEIAKNAYDTAVAQKEEKDREARLGYEKALQDYNKAAADHGRISQLAAAGFISQTELEQSANAMNDARRQKESYRVEDGKGCANRSFELAVSNAAWELQKKQEELEKTRITSAIDGTVVRVNSKVGQFADKVEDDKPMFSIENLEQLELELKVSEFSVGKVKIGQKAVISADILGSETEEGQVVKISPTGEEKGGGSTERVVPATIRIEGENTRLIAGINARAQLMIDEAEDAFVVPSSALAEGENGTCIAVADQGILRWIPVQTGVDADVAVQVIPETEGSLKEGMQVLSEPDISLKEGTKITALPVQ